MFWRYQWWRTRVVQQLKKAGAYVYASFEIYYGRMSESFSPSCVRSLQYAAKANDASLYRTYVVLMDFQLRSDSGRDIICTRKMWLIRTAQLRHSQLLVVPEHRRNITYIARQEIRNSGRQLDIHDLKPVLAQNLPTLSFPVAVGVWAVRLMKAPSNSDLLPVSTLPSHFWQMYNQMELVLWSSLIFSSLCTDNESITSNESSYNSMVSVPRVSSGDNASAAWFLTPARCTAPNSNSQKQGPPRTNFPVAFTRLRIPFNTLWSVRMVHLRPFKCGLNKKAAQSTAKHVQCVLS